ncbi:MAG: cytochrome b/b6 [Pseudomonadota bacterium]
MSGIPQDHYEPHTKAEKWVDDRLPIIRLAFDFIAFPTPKNLNWMWIWGVMLTVFLMIQIVTGIVLVMHYTAHVDTAFASVEHIMRNVNGGWLIRYIHMNGASFFFIAVYAHIFRSLYYGSYKAPREITWIIGILIYLLMMGTAFMGYVLPWGQMSFWGATVITGLFSALPLIGEPLQTWLVGGPSVDNATLTRFFALHYLMPFLILGLTVVHIWAFHTTGNNNPDGVSIRKDNVDTTKRDTVPFHPFYTIKDMYALVLFLLLFAAVVFFMPNYLGHPDNYVEANPLVTPAHIVPEWYFLPFYAMLRAIDFDILFIDSKLGGVIAMFGSIVIMALAPWTDTSRVRSAKYRPQLRIYFWILVVDFFVLMWAGAMPAEGLIPTISLIGTIYWFAYFLVILPLLGILETPEPQPTTVEEAFKQEHPDAPAIGHNGGFIVGTGSGQTAGVGPTLGNGNGAGSATPAE